MFLRFTTWEFVASKKKKNLKTSCLLLIIPINRMSVQHWVTLTEQPDSKHEAVPRETWKEETNETEGKHLAAAAVTASPKTRPAASWMAVNTSHQLQSPMVAESSYLGPGFQ